MDKHKFIPSMFHRRLLLVLAVMLAAMSVLGGQMFRLSVVEGAQRRAIAESKLDSRTFLPTTRGRVLDRHGRVLALDQASYDIAVEFDVITGGWINTKAGEQARKEVGRTRWNELNPEQRAAEINKRMAPWQAKADRLWGEIRRAGKLSDEQLRRNLDAIKADVNAKAAAVAEQQYIRERNLYGISEEEFQANPIREQSQPHVILARVPDTVAFDFKRLEMELPGMFEVASSTRREYPWLNAEVPLPRNSLPRGIRKADPVTIRVSGVADHVLGSMRDEVWAEDIQRRPFFEPGSSQPRDLGGYLPGDAVGARGVERVFEDVLRGLRGEVRERRDTRERHRTEPKPGRDLQLSIDVALQARVQAVLSSDYGLTKVQPWQANQVLPQGMALNSAAVVLEVETGEILAMVTMPTLAMGKAMGPLRRHMDQPMVNRAVEAVYPPGSIIKPFTLAAGVTEGVLSLGSTVVCRGHYFEDPTSKPRCWIYRPKFGMRGHDALGAEEALARSCNIFFYTIADRLGMERLSKWFGRFGLGEHLHTGLAHEMKDKDGRTIVVGESAGEVPSAQSIKRLKDLGQLRFSQVIMGIGQGPITWTPMHAANAYATLARGGVIRDATLVLDDPRGTRPRRGPDLQLSRPLVEAALEGLRCSVMEDYGTGHHITYEAEGVKERIINAEKVNVWAKTGTAQAPAMPVDSNRDGQIDKKDQPVTGVDHSWFVGLVGPKDSNKPMHAIAVVVEYGGSGGRTSGPIANQIIKALQAEGYLPGDPNSPAPEFVKAGSRSDPEPADENEEVRAGGDA